MTTSKRARSDRLPGGHRVAAAAVLLALAIAAAGVFLASTEQARRAALTSRIDSRRTTAAAFVAAYAAGQVTHEKQVATSRLGATDPHAAATAFAQVSADSDLPTAVMLDAQGRLMSVQPPAPALIGLQFATRYTHLAQALSGVATPSNVVLSAARHQAVIAFAVPFTAKDGSRRVFSVGYPVTDTPLAPFMRNALALPGSWTLLVDANNVVIASSGQALPAGTDLAHDRQWGPATAKSGMQSLDGHGYYLSVGPVAGTPWRMVLASPTAQLFASLSGAPHWVPWLALGGFAIAAAAALALWRRSQGEHARAVTAERLRTAIVETAPDAFIGMDDHGRVTDWNTAAERLLGWPSVAAVGRDLAGLIIPAGQLSAGHPQSWQEPFVTEEAQPPIAAIQLDAMHRDGHLIPVELTLSRLPWQGSWRFHGFLRDVTERRLHEAQLQELAMTDPLTGLANRRTFIERLDQALARATRQNHPIAVLYIDLNGFKAVNDRHGHGAGDQLLGQVADRLRETLRTEDTIARLGGDEFAVICEDLQDVQDLAAVTVRIGQVLAGPYLIDDEHLAATASIGATASYGEETAAAVLSRADAAMYANKTSGTTPSQNRPQLALRAIAAGAVNESAGAGQP